MVKSHCTVLLDELNKIKDLFWIRIMYCYPEEIYEGLIDAMIRNKKGMPLSGYPDPACK